MKALDEAMAKMVQGGHAQDAQVAFNGLADAAAKEGVSVEQLKEMLPQYSQALDEAAKKGGDAGIAAADAAIQYDKLAKQLAAVSVTADTLAGTMADKVFNAFMSIDQANLSVAESLTKVSDSFKENGRELDIHTARGQANREAVLSAVQANMKMYDTNIATGMSAQDAAAAYDKNTQALRDQLHAAHLTDAQINDLIGRYATVPDDVNTNIQANGLTQAIDDLNDLIRKLNGLPPLKTITIDIWQRNHTSGVADFREHHGERWGGAYTHAASGLLNLRDASIYSTASPARYAFAEPATGGEAFVPKYGDRMRSMSILSEAASWYGAVVMPSGASGAAAGSDPNLPRAIAEHLAPLLAGMTTVVGPLRVTPEGLALAVRKGERNLRKVQ